MQHVQLASFNGKEFSLSKNFQKKLIITLSSLVMPFYAFITAKQRGFATEGLSEVDQDICDAAIGIFHSVLVSLSDGTITAQLLQKLTNKIDQVNKIIEAITQTPSREEEIAATKEILAKKEHEYFMFTKYREELQYLCHHLEDLKIEGTFFFSHTKC